MTSPVSFSGRRLLAGWSSLAFSLLLLAASADPARAARGGPDAFGNTWEDVNGGCPVMSDPFQLANSASFWNGTSDLNFLGPFDLGFSFPFYGQPKTQIWVHRSGLIFFQQPPDNPLATNQPIPYAGDGISGFIAPFWSSYGNVVPSIYYEQFLASGYFKLSFTMFPNSGDRAISFEVYLYQSGEIRVEYLDPSNASTGTIGVESPDESTGLQVWYNTAPTAGITFGTPTPFSICFHRSPNLDCAGATPLPCGAALRGTLPGASSRNVNTYGCGTGALNGREKIYRLNLDQITDLSVTLAPDAGKTMSVYLLNGCNEWLCLGGGGLSANAQGLAPGSYYVVVDAPNVANEGGFTLTVNCTLLSEPIRCEETVVGTSSGKPNKLDGYGCLGGDFSGPEAYYVLDFPGPPGNINISLRSLAGHGAFVFDATKPLSAVNCLSGGVGGTIIYDPPAGKYVVVVDGPSGSGGNFTITANCAPAISCTPGAGPLTCNETVNGSTNGRLNLVNFYRCRSQLYDGPEAVYTFTNPTKQVVSFILDDSVDPRLDLILMTSCNEGACLEYADNELDKELDPGTYYLAVDGQGGVGVDFTLSVVCGAGLEPSTISVVKAAGECFIEDKTAWITPDIRQADVLFMIDLTGSMSDERSNLVTNMQTIIDQLQIYVQDVNFGLASYKDYPIFENITMPCTYNTSLGGGGDYAYRLHQPITSVRADIQNAVSSLPGAGGGNDGPESYSRALFETYSDLSVGWRPGSRRIVVDFGDEMPHDCNVLSCFGELGFSRGIDPGRDNTPGTTDDLALADVIQGMSDNRVVLLHLDSSPGGREGSHTYRDIWDCWAAKTGGQAVQLDSRGIPPGGVDLPHLIGDLISQQGSYCSRLELVATPGFESWLVTSSPVYTNVDLPSVKTFQIEICVPAGTLPGVYDFEVQCLCSGGIVATQQVHVTVSTECAPSITALPPDRVICEGDRADLDGRGVGLVNCGGTVTYKWTDGARVVGNAAQVFDTPADTTDYLLTVTCSTKPTCTTSDVVHVEVQRPPIFTVANVRDIARCSLGIELTWQPAVFRDPSMSGGYNVYRSEVSCAEAMTRRPVADALVDTRWVDVSTRDGRTYYYVVEAEDLRSSTVCKSQLSPPGPPAGFHGGAATRLCLPAQLEVFVDTFPAGVFATLRASHVGQQVSMLWSLARAPIAPDGEHYHLRRAMDHPLNPWIMVNPEADVTRIHTETETSSKLQFFDLRMANACETTSLPEYPPG